METPQPPRGMCSVEARVCLSQLLSIAGIRCILPTKM